MNACLALATPAYEGSFSEAEWQRVMRSYEALCLAGFPAGCSLRGLGYMKGSNKSPVDEAKARELFEQGCKEGDRLGCLFRDLLARGGKPDPKDPHSLELLDAMCDLDNGFACMLLGGFYSQGDDVPRNMPRAVKYLERGCNNGSSFACVIIAGYRVDGSNGVSKDEALGIQEYELACDGGQGAACTIVGLAHIQAVYGVREDHVIGAALIKRGCELGYAEGCSAYGELLRTGDGVPMDVERAKTVWDDACAHGSGDACAKRGKFYYDAGEMDKATPLFERSCKLGFPLGCKIIEMLKNP